MSGSFRGQSPQNFDPPLTMSRRRADAVSPVHTSVTEVDVARSYPRTVTGSGYRVAVSDPDTPGGRVRVTLTARYVYFKPRLGDIPARVSEAGPSKPRRAT